jgi:hypothetical protein
MYYFQMYLPHLKFASPCIIIQFKYINQLDAEISQVYYLTFMYSSTCFGRHPAHHQEVCQTTTKNAPAASLQR